MPGVVAGTRRAPPARPREALCGAVGRGGARAAALAVLALAALALAVPERAQAQTLEDRHPSGDCRDLNEYPNCGIGLSIDQRAGGYSDGGAIQSAGDGDLWTVVLYRAQSYLIEVKGAGDPGGDNGGTLPDPWVEIYELTYDMGTRRFDPTLRASNDNVNATNKNARVVYTYPPGTTPQTPIGIRVRGANGATGSYTVSVKGLEGLALTETADCAGDETTACSIEVGGTVRGTVSSTTDDRRVGSPVGGGQDLPIRRPGRRQWRRHPAGSEFATERGGWWCL